MQLKDPFLNRVSCIKRLVAEWEEHKQIIVAYEFDNTVFDPHREGTTFPVVIDLLRQAEHEGFHLVVFTGRSEELIPTMTEYLNTNRIPFHYVNRSPECIPFQSQKVFYNLLLDSRAGLSEAVDQLKSMLAHVRSVKSMTSATLEIG